MLYCFAVRFPGRYLSARLQGPVPVFGVPDKVCCYLPPISWQQRHWTVGPSLTQTTMTCSKPERMHPNSSNRNLFFSRLQMPKQIWTVQSKSIQTHCCVLASVGSQIASRVQCKICSLGIVLSAHREWVKAMPMPSGACSDIASNSLWAGLLRPSLAAKFARVSLCEEPIISTTYAWV